MTQPTTYRGAHVGIFLEDTANPGTFLKPCGLSTNSISFSKNLNEVTVPDCDDPDLPAWIERETASLTMSASGSGILAAEAVDTWDAAWRDTDSINARIYVGKADNTVNGKYWAGRIHLESFEVSGNTGEKAQVTVSLVSDGEITYNAVV